MSVLAQTEMKEPIIIERYYWRRLFHLRLVFAVFAPHCGSKKGCQLTSEVGEGDGMVCFLL